VPYGDEDEARPIGEMIIGNEHTYEDNTANYVYAYRDDKGVEEFGHITRFDRSEGIWKLISRCLKEDNISYTEFEDVLRERFKEIT
jgi:hypothetical protein